MWMEQVLQLTRWSGLLVLFPKGVGWCMLCGIMPFLPGLAGIWEGEWLTFGSSPVTADDVEVWPYSVGLWVKLVTFLGCVALTVGTAAGSRAAGGGCLHLAGCRRSSQR